MHFICFNCKPISFICLNCKPISFTMIVYSCLVTFGRLFWSDREGSVSQLELQYSALDREPTDCNLTTREIPYRAAPLTDLSNNIRIDRHTWWNRLLRYPDVALNPFMGLETMVGSRIRVLLLRRPCGKIWQRCRIVWNELSV